MNRTAFVFLILICSGLFLVPPNTAHADGNHTDTNSAHTPKEATLADEYNGFWAAGSCQGPYSYLGYSKKFTLIAEQNMLLLGYYARTEAVKDYYVISANGISTANKIRPDGQLEQIMLTMPSDENMKDMPTWDEYKPLYPMNYEHCAPPLAGWQTVDPVGLSAFSALDKLHENCRAGQHSATAARRCIKSFFSAADFDSNGTIDKEELIRLYRAIFYLDTGISKTDFAVFFPGDSAEKAPIFANDVLAVFDRNGSNTIGFDEAAENWRVATAEPKLAQSVKMVAGLYDFINFTHAEDETDSCAITFDDGILSHPDLFIQYLKDGQAETLLNEDNSESTIPGSADTVYEEPQETLRTDMTEEQSSESRDSDQSHDHTDGHAH